MKHFCLLLLINCQVNAWMIPKVPSHYQSLRFPQSEKVPETMQTPYVSTDVWRSSSSFGVRKFALLAHSEDREHTVSTDLPHGLTPPLKSSFFTTTKSVSGTVKKILGIGLLSILAVQVFSYSSGNNLGSLLDTFGSNHASLKPLSQLLLKSSTYLSGIIGDVTRDATEAFAELSHEVQGARRDVLILLLSTALVIPAFKWFNLSPILGFLTAGCALGPNGLSLVSDVKTIATLAEFGVVFFLFEMGLELSVERLYSMRRDVFGLGFAQLAVTTTLAALMSPLVIPHCTTAAQLVIGSGLALSSSAFVLQLLREKNEVNTKHGRAAFGILLFQDLAIVPMLVAIPLLAGGGGGGVFTALRQSLVKSGIALSTIALIGRFLLSGVFKVVAISKNQESFLSLVLLTVTGMSILTEGLGLSNTLGAFLAGVLLSETNYRHQVEADIVPFRGLFLGLFFITIGFSIDCKLIATEAPRVLSLVGGLLCFKSLVIAAICKAFKMSTSHSTQTGMLLSQGGEFSFVAFQIAQSLNILSDYQSKLLMTSTALSMALTPSLANLGSALGRRFEGKEHGISKYVGLDIEGREIKKDLGLIVVCGYGRIGKVVCEVLDKKMIRYIAFDVDPFKTIEARNRGLPVFYGDVSRPEVLHSFNVGNAKMVVTAMSDKETTNKAVVTLRRLYPDLPIMARASDAEHQNRLINTLGVSAMTPKLPMDSMLLSLPFGGAVLSSLGYNNEEVSSIIKNLRNKAFAKVNEDKKVNKHNHKNKKQESNTENTK